MWGRHYWAERSDNGGDRGSIGIVVFFAWLSSQESHLKPYLRLFSSLRWSSLVCHSDFATLFFPEKAASLGDSVLKELIKELKVNPKPVVFASFSGGPKGCTYKVLQLINRRCKGQHTPDEYKLVQECLCGLIFDSSPTDFKSDIGTNFVLHPTVLKMSQPPRVLSWMARAFASGLNTLFIKNFEEQRADYWKTLYASANVGPILILCSEDDDLAPYSVISDFAKQLEERAADVRFISWKSSRHVSHYKYHSDEYRSRVSDLLKKAAALYSSRNNELNSQLTRNSTPNSILKLQKTASKSNQKLKAAPSNATDQYLLPSSMEYEENQEEEETKPDLLQTRNVPNYKLSGVLGQILFDGCEPKDVEGWDLNLSLLPNFRTNNSGFNPMKCIRRSRL